MTITSFPSCTAHVVFLATALVGFSTVGLSLESPTTTTPEVRVLASKVVTKAVRSRTGVSVETAVVALRVGYGDLPLNTNAGQVSLKARVADAAKDACSRVGAAFRPGVHITSTSECVETAIKDAQLQIDAVIAAANTRGVGTL